MRRWHEASIADQASRHPVGKPTRLGSCHRNQRGGGGGPVGFRAMPTLSALELFAVAAFALIIIPGPAVLYIVSQSVGQGRVGGLAAVLGVETGAFVHVAGAALGVSAILASSATAFSALKLAGGAYLIVLGIRRLLERDSESAPGTARTRPLSLDLPPGRDRQRAQPQDGALLPRLPAPVRRSRARARRPAGGDPRPGLGRHRRRLRRRLGARLAAACVGLLRTSARARRVERRASGGILIGLGVLATLAHPARR